MNSVFHTPNSQRLIGGEKVAFLRVVHSAGRILEAVLRKTILFSLPESLKATGRLKANSINPGVMKGV